MYLRLSLEGALTINSVMDNKNTRVCLNYINKMEFCTVFTLPLLPKFCECQPMNQFKQPTHCIRVPQFVYLNVKVYSCCPNVVQKRN